MRPPRELVVIARAVRVQHITDGTPTELPASTQAQMMQALGLSLALLVDGQLMLVVPFDPGSAAAQQIPSLEVVLSRESISFLVQCCSATKRYLFGQGLIRGPPRIVVAEETLF